MQKNKQIGVIVDDLSASQLSYYLIKNINEFLEDGLDDFVVLKSFSPERKIFYVWDLEWLRRHGKEFENTVKAFTDSEVTLIARSKEHALAIENYCNTKIKHIVEDFNIKKLIRIINDE